MDPKRFCCDLCQRMFCLCSPLGVLLCLALHLGIWSILSLFLCVILENVLISFFYMQLSTSPGTIYWRDSLFPIVYSCLLCHRLIYPKCVGLFLAYLSCSIDLCFSFCTRNILFCWVKFCGIVWVKESDFLPTNKRWRGCGWERKPVAPLWRTGWRFL